MGLVINRPTTTRVTSIVSLEPPIETESDLTAWIGGPVDSSRAWIISAVDPQTPDRIELAEGLFLCASAQALRLCLEANHHPCRFLLGYAGWAPGQLESEMAASAWLNAAVDHSLIFDTPAEQIWDATIRSLGINPVALQMGPGVH